MIANVRIEVRERGKLIELREGHNIMVDRGRAWLASLMAADSFDPDVPEADARIRYMGAGVGSRSQNLMSVATSSPVTDLYPAGFDPEATTGNSYQKEYPIAPAITTLERPIKIFGSTTDDYSTAPLTDVWLIEDAPNGRFLNTHQTLTSATFHGRIYDDEAMLGGFFTELPLSEIGLFTDEVAVSKNAPYSPLVAYFDFDTIRKTPDNELTFIWSLRF